MRLLRIAAGVALGNKCKNPFIRKDYLLAAVIQRKDGAIVVSANSLSHLPTPSGHAEARAIRKADVGSTLYVARVTRDGEWAMSKPCKHCQALIRNRGIKKVYYTIGPGEYGVWDVWKSKTP
jgi:tRNA(Arg) A34 adenosine deaminase TadA